MRYAVVDKATGTVVNIAEWDGKAPWMPGDVVEVRKAIDIDAIGSASEVDRASLPVEPPTSEQTA